MKSQYYIPEKEIQNMPKSIPIEIMEILIPKAKSNICKIECNNGGSGTGFFCNIPFGWKNIMKVLITNNHVLTNNDILIGKKIKFSINNGMIKYEIEQERYIQIKNMI